MPVPAARATGAVPGALLITDEQEQTVSIPNSEHASTYYVQDRSNQEELKRLVDQDQMMTTSMGGVLTEQSDTSRLRRVLDIACGTGGWLIQLAREYPTVECVGVDISGKMMEYAREQATLQQVQARVEFLVMDALRMLEFPDRYFDLVNLRFGVSFIRTWEWTKMLQEMRRICKPGGIVRISDLNLLHSTSPALDHIMLQIGLPAAIRAGYSFGDAPDSMEKQLLRLLAEHRFLHVRQQDYPVEYLAGTSQHRLFVEDIRRMLRLAPAFWGKWATVPENFEELYQQAMLEVEQPDFVANWPLFTLWSRV